MVILADLMSDKMKVIIDNTFNIFNATIQNPLFKRFLTFKILSFNHENLPAKQMLK